MYLEFIYQILPMNQTLMTVILVTILLTSLSSSFFEFSGKNKLSKKNQMKSIKKISSLFLSFDPKSSLNLPFQEMNWFIMTLLLIFLFMSWTTFPSRSKVLFMKIWKEMGKQLKIALKSSKDSTKIMFTSVFIFIFFSNFIGLVPNSFTSSSHITLNLMISLPLWAGFFLYGWNSYSKKMFSHLVPSGTPLPLISFMVLIELISTSIRPFTLSIRLMANMVSGHLLLTLMGNTMNLKSPIMVILLSLVQTMLSSLELGVSMIQAYVFCILLTLYSDDSDYSE